jgi:hypothetical protein
LYHHDHHHHHHYHHHIRFQCRTGWLIYFHDQITCYVLLLFVMFSCSSLRSFLLFFMFFLLFLTFFCSFLYSFCSFLCFFSCLVYSAFYFVCSMFLCFLCHVSPHVHGRLFSICVPVYWLLLPAGNPVAVNEYHTVYYL